MSAETRSLTGTTVAITGASSGIGRAAARALVNAGANVAIQARRAERLAELAAELGDDNVAVVPGDVRLSTDNQKLIATAVERFGRLDSLVANAGVGAYGSVLDGSDDEVVEMVETNVTGTMWSIRAALPALLDGGGGDVVVVASVAGLRGGGHEAVYASTKFAQVGLAGAVDRELREKNIRVTAICPASVHTEFAMGRGRTEDMPELADALQPEDIAAAIVTVLKQPRRMRTQIWSMWPMTEGS